MGKESNKIECMCHRCNYRWQYRGHSKFIASCPRCKMTVYIPKMLRFLNESRGEHGSPIDVNKKLDSDSDSSMIKSKSSDL
jgi:hypothetical protein